MEAGRCLRIVYPDKTEFFWTTDWETVTNKIRERMQKKYPRHEDFHMEWRQDFGIGDPVHLSTEELWNNFLAAFDEQELISIHVVSDPQRALETSPFSSGQDAFEQSIPSAPDVSLASEPWKSSHERSSPFARHDAEVPRRKKIRGDFGNRFSSQDQVFGTSDSDDLPFVANSYRSSPAAMARSPVRNYPWQSSFDELLQHNDRHAEAQRETHDLLKLPSPPPDDDAEVDDVSDEVQRVNLDDVAAVESNSDFVCPTCKTELFNEFKYVMHIRHCKLSAEREEEASDEKEREASNGHRADQPEPERLQSFPRVDSGSFMPAQSVGGVACKYCEAPFSMDVITTHEASCGTRTDKCEGCGRYVQKKDLLSHVCRDPTPPAPSPPAPLFVPPSASIMYPSSAFLSHADPDPVPISALSNDAFYSMPSFPSSLDVDRAPSPEPYQPLRLRQSFDTVCSGIGLGNSNEEALKIYMMLKNIVEQIRGNPSDANRTVLWTKFAENSNFKLFLEKIGFEEIDQNFVMSEINYAMRFVTENEEAGRVLDAEIKKREERIEEDRRLQRRIAEMENSNGLLDLWTCACTFRNRPTAPICQICFQPRRDSVLDDISDFSNVSRDHQSSFAYPDEFLSDGMPPDPTDNTWSCRRCTFKNTPAVLLCEMCNLPLE